MTEKANKYLPVFFMLNLPVVLLAQAAGVLHPIAAVVPGVKNLTSDVHSLALSYIV